MSKSGKTSRIPTLRFILPTNFGVDPSGPLRYGSRQQKSIHLESGAYTTKELIDLRQDGFTIEVHDIKDPKTGKVVEKRLVAVPEHSIFREKDPATGLRKNLGCQENE